MTNPDYNLYFFDIKKGKALKQLLDETGQRLKDDQHLFRFWAKELLYAFKDLTYKSTYTLAQDISLKNLYIADLGIKIYVKKLKFAGLREENIDYHLQTEAKMLHCYGRILMEMLTADLDDQPRLVGSIDEILSNLDILPELKAIIYECLHAQDKVQEKEVEAYNTEINHFILLDKMRKAKT